MPSSTVTVKSAEVSSQLAKKLEQVGFKAKTIQKLLSDYPHERIARQLSWLKYRNPIKPAALLRDAIREDWSPPRNSEAATSLAPQAVENESHVGNQSAQKADETREKLARVKDEQEAQKRRHEKLVAIEKKLSEPKRDALRLQAERQVRQHLGRSWPQSKPIPQTFLDAEYYGLIEAEFVKKKTP